MIKIQDYYNSEIYDIYRTLWLDMETYSPYKQQRHDNGEGKYQEGTWGEPSALFCCSVILFSISFLDWLVQSSSVIQILTSKCEHAYTYNTLDSETPMHFMVMKFIWSGHLSRTKQNDYIMKYMIHLNALHDF